jgi:glycosyltransferase involved in cell wall biosynthesis/UDP:flavonoid glycosyltransferase YjiC (YdhE family)
MHVILSRGFAGSERAAAEACAALSGRHDVALVVRSDHRGQGGASILDELEPGIEVFEVPPRFGTQRRLERIIRAWAPDVLHTHLRRGTRYVARIGLANVGLPQSVHVATLHLSINGPHYLETDGLFCISEWQIDTVPRDYRGQVFLVPNSLVPHPRLDAARLRELRASLGAGEDDYVVGAVGRLAHRKGFDLLIRAFERARLPAARLVIVGDGSHRHRLERLAGERVTLTGFRRDVKDLYQAFDLFVCPSSYEPFGRVIIEALDSGVPVISTDAQGPSDIAKRHPVKLVPCGDEARLAEALQQAAAAGRMRVEADLAEFDMERIAARVGQAYGVLLSAKRSAVPLSASPTVADSIPAAGAPIGAPLPRFLFAPVSGPGGAGELMRCLIIARELARAEPSADIRFLVSRSAVFRDAVEFPIIDCDASPTNSTPQVLAAIESFRPHVMVFDNSGRTAQLRAAKRAGARLVFSSRAPKLRWKAFRLKWMRLLDEHWIVFPTFVTGGLTWIERRKLALFPGYAVRRLDTLFPPADPGARREWLARHGLERGGYVVFVPGGRSEGQRIAEPAEHFIDAARRFCANTGYPSVVLTGRKTVDQEPEGNPRLLPRVAPEEVQYLLAEATMVVSNGGTTLVHALAHGRPLVAVPLAGDQARRIRRAVRLGIAASAPPDAGKIADAAAALLADPGRREDMPRQIAALGIANGVDEAVGALLGLARRGLA